MDPLSLIVATRTSGPSAATLAAVSGAASQPNPIKAASSTLSARPGTQFSQPPGERRAAAIEARTRVLGGMTNPDWKLFGHSYSLVFTRASCLHSSEVPQRTLSRCMASVFGANPVEHTQHTQGAFSFHAVEQGPGPVVLLLPGWPQTNYAWRQVMPLLSGEYQGLEPFVTEAPRYGLNQSQYFMQYLHSIRPATQATLAADDHLDELKKLLKTPLDQG